MSHLWSLHRGRDDERLDTGPETVAGWLKRLELPLRGLESLTELRATLRAVERELVLAARANRSTWHEIGNGLGVSRQAAWRRHDPGAPRRSSGD